ncbi:secondary thiamine-phosphate synthase enzyme YjbQ [Thermodesulfatator autotrophicus]|uniref:Secondary thiamine-phosphate synthase enzyme n=1 Tax=Thermodesulfatator autotrophicus TaxID=1795632 RepID=A0A177E4P5_9BACT|nr:secondary thiamine-phosphate synthase enzyme YjbQ [Thermodesulfatator autotrophicus]OAG26937.1 secondary thiamine-phosphate synthase enzyme [Thermodesulfatator autotrophicus]
MIIKTYEVTIKTQGFCDIHDLTPLAQRFIEEAGLTEGQLLVHVPGSTAGVTTIEYEPGVLSDLCRALEKIAPQDIPYEHDKAWGDGNGFSHVRAALMKPSLVVPVASASLLLGTWQQIVLLDFDNRPRNRRLIFQVMGR